MAEEVNKYEKYGLSFEYPPGWRFQEEAGNSSCGNVTVFKLTPLGDFIWTTRMMVEWNEEWSEVDPEYLADIYVASEEQDPSLTDVEVIERSPTSVDGNKAAARLLKLRNLEGDEIKERHVIFTSSFSQRLIEIRYYAPVFLEDEAAFNLVVSTFREDRPDPLLTKPKILWERKFGGPGFETARDVQQTEDGGYVLVGTARSYGSGGSDIWVIKTDSEGNERWNRTLGGQGDDEGYSIQQTKDGGYVVAGSTRSYSSGGSDIWVVKLDGKGDREWDRSFGGPREDEGRSVKQTRDLGYIVAGYTTNQGRDLHVIKMDSDGNKQWEKTLGKGGDEEGSSVDEAGDGYVITGYTTSFGAGGKDVWLVRLDSNGSRLWDTTFGNPIKTSGPSPSDVGSSVRQTGDGGFIIVGSSESGYGNPDLWLIKTDPKGKKEWDRRLGGREADEGLSVQIAKGGGYLLAGRTKSFGAGGYDAWLVRTNSTGYELWNMAIGGSGDEAAYSVEETRGGGCILAGLFGGYGSSGDAWLIKLG
jgi:predicted secreted protein